MGNQPSNTCGLAPMAPTWGGDCSNGVCNVTADPEVLNTCVCEPGWTGQSDWVNMEGIDCQVNILAVQILWIINLAVSVLSAAASAPKLLKLFQKHQRVKKSMSSAGKVYTIRDNKGSFALLIFYLFCFPFQIALGVWKLVDPTIKIAIDVVPTILWFVTRSGFYISAGVFQPSLLASVMRGTRAAEIIIQRNNRFGFYVSLGSVLVTLFAVPNVVTGGRDFLLAEATIVAYFLGQALVLFCLALQAQLLKRKITHILDESHKTNANEKTLEIKDRLNSVQHSAERATLVQFMVYLCFGIIPFMWNKHDYLLPITWLTLPLIGRRATNAVSEGKTKTSRRGTMSPGSEGTSETNTATSGKGSTALAVTGNSPQ